MAPLALERCVGDPVRFVRDEWARRPVYLAGADRGTFADLLTLDDVDRMVSSMALRLPTFRLIRDGATIPESAYTKSGRAGSKPMTGLADPARIFRLFDEGATIVLQGMHRFWEPLARFCRELEIALGHPTQVNAYITPPGSRGFGVHEDAHDVFVLQAFGAKHWEVWATGQPVMGGSEQGPPMISAELQPGNALYMPRHTPHAARTQQALSGHLTIGILTTTWRQALERVVERTLDEAGVDEPLPAGYHRDPEEFAAQMDARLSDFRRRLEKSAPGDAAQAVIDRFLTTRPPLLRGTLAGLARAATIGDHSVLGRRPGSVCELRIEDDRLTVLLGDRALHMPARCEPAMRHISTRGAFRVGDLEPYMDPDGRLVLARRLVREGLLEVVGAD